MRIRLYMPKTDKKTSQQGGSRGMLYILLALAVVSVAFLLAVYPMVMDGNDTAATIKIPANATEKNVADTLTKYFGKGYADKVLRLTRIRNVNFAERNGAYLIEAGTSPFQTMRRLTRGAQTPVRVVINGFRDRDLLTDRVSAKFEFPADSLRMALADAEFMSQFGLTPEQAMSLFVEDTYEFYWTATARDVITKIGDNYKHVWNKKRSTAAFNMGLTPAEVMTICSIVDEETNAPQEKGIIGRLYINRLRQGMKLQADPTVRFAANDFTLRRVLKVHLNIDSPYNTYLYAGLPPGPIRTTSVKTIDAVLSSKPHNYLYMCAKEDLSGTHNFATNYTEHHQNALRYRRELDRRGIK